MGERPNPHEAPLRKFLFALSRPVSDGYLRLRNGQIVREDTYEHWKLAAHRRRRLRESERGV